MRAAGLALIFGSATRLVKSAPNPHTNIGHDEVKEPRGASATAVLLRRLDPILDPILGLHWTLHKSCYEDKQKRDAIINSVNAAKDRSQLAVDRLGEWRNDPVMLEQLAILLPELGDYAAMFDTAIKMFTGVASIEGPVGPPVQDKNDKGEPIEIVEGRLADSPEWGALKNEDHWRNIAFYCAPTIAQEQRDILGLQWYDYGQRRWLDDEHSLVAMQNDVDAKKFLDPERALEAVTLVSYGENKQNKDRTPAKRRRDIPATITIHPLFLESIRDVVTGEYHIGADKDLNKTVEALFDAARQNRIPASPPEISYAHGLTSLIHHELFHTPGLGDLVDEQGEDSYGWVNMVDHGSLRLPDWYALMGLFVEFLERGIQVTSEGILEVSLHS